ncbi:Zn-dependent hydrolase [Labilibaculum euxinus]|uniref:Zn-dependent hydrolase n=1 Tax=Labilibaculum euxinus TaxID=2686357 RepID=A0A7M4D256_9BACT|nr:Zn-dependent hydrolase [Labilibaculum euxinus]MUP36735.1 Zn-dependent hydrolase [Labilibaculum euxinus]MVB05940.1 Zn-dependent hydrolase [Labilibaculum euxinus]
MNRKLIILYGLIISIVFAFSCQPNKKTEEKEKYDSVMKRKLANYVKVQLSADLSNLTANQIKLFSQLIRVSNEIDEIYWLQAYGDKNQLLNKITDPDMREYAMINYGPWDRLDGFAPFTDDFPPRPLGIGFFPDDITQEEFFSLKNDNKYSAYTTLTRTENGLLKVLPYHIAYQSHINNAVSALQSAAELCETKDFKEYLLQRAEDLLSDNFEKSDHLWMNLKTNPIDFIAGPISNTEDHFIWTKYSYGAFILLRNIQWTKDVEKYSLLLPYLQKSLPVSDEYKNETPSESAEIVIYDVLYNSGYCNAGNKLIGLNLPIGNSITTSAKKLHFKNVMQAKFEQILQPITNLVIEEKQRKHVSFKSFFLNTIFYEISDGLGISQTINGKGSVKEALKEHYNVINEVKNDVLRMFFLGQLTDMGQIDDVELMDNYVTYMADVFRSIRFGVKDSQGVANMIRFYYFEENEAFKYNPKSGTYKVNFYKMKKAIESLSKLVLEIEGNGDYETADQLIKTKGFIHNELLQDLYRIQRAKVPKDLVYDQGEKVIISSN